MVFDYHREVSGVTKLHDDQYPLRGQILLHDIGPGVADDVDVVAGGEDVDLVHAELLLLLVPASRAHLLHHVALPTRPRHDQPGLAEGSFAQQLFLVVFSRVAFAVDGHCSGCFD